MRKWKPNFDLKSAAIEEVLVWIRFPDLPLEYYDEEILEVMGNEVGRTVKVDMSTSLHARGGYARVGVEVDLSKPLLPVYILGKVERPIVYEGLHLLCYNCGKYGHTEKECKEEKIYQEHWEDRKGEEQVMETRPYGDWTVVQNSRRGRRGGADNRKGQVKQGVSGSRFANLATMEDKEDDREMHVERMPIVQNFKEWVKKRKNVLVEKVPTLEPMQVENVNEEGDKRSQGGRSYERLIPLCFLKMEE
ncbi:uncharacterized protein LOC114726174 [Neltuma alba]|uniref:uncharacterized protein LOC114726174 n=1 Tax=Neltuma alba TaxID=207710 RepID=UPI0010A58D1D|nr:uncharacterized protein LOC114726174 [Prosopis alba]